MPYQAYMLRLWSNDQEGHRVWRASLENAHDPERLHFSDLETLFAFLQQKTAELDRLDAGESLPDEQERDS